METLVFAMLAGFVATVVLSAMMLDETVDERDATDGYDRHDLHDLRHEGHLAQHGLGHPLHRRHVLYAAFWLFMSLVGGAGAFWLKGAIVGSIGWLIAMLALMPMAGNGVFGVKLGAMVPVMTRRAGPRAERDIWRSAPPMAAMA